MPSKPKYSVLNQFREVVKIATKKRGKQSVVTPTEVGEFFKTLYDKPKKRQMAYYVVEAAPEATTG